jgi:hypothetical protein
LKLIWAKPAEPDPTGISIDARVHVSQPS